MNAAKRRADLVIMMPVGPTCKLEYIKDTLDSMFHYRSCSTAVVILDDSGIGTGDKLRELSSDIFVVQTPQRRGKGFGLYLTFSQGFHHILENFDFKVVLRSDTDALITGYGAELEAMKVFDEEPNIGILGSWKITCMGERREFGPQGREIRLAVNPLRCLLHRDRTIGLLKRADWRGLWRMTANAWPLRKLFLVARANGYEPGEHCMGGVCFYSERCIRQLAERGVLGRTEFCTCFVEEDHIFGLLVYAAGMRLGDFATGEKPMGLKWSGLPCSPKELHARKKKIIHSTKCFTDINEQEIRRQFRAWRENGE